MNIEEKAFHQSRRKEFAKQIGRDSIAIIFGNTNQNQSYDADFKFKQYKNFFYLTGLKEQNAALVLAPSGFKIKTGEEFNNIHEALFVQKNDNVMETWNGRRLGFGNVNKALGIESGFVNTELNQILSSRDLKNYRRLYINFSELIKVNDELKNIAGAFIENLNIKAAGIEIIDASYILGKMRSVKTQFEINQIQKACDITIRSYRKTMKMIKPEIFEYQVQANLEYNYKYNGSEENAYNPIVAGGENACILHYSENNNKLKSGDLLLIDSGAEYNYYCSDITRTFPVSGKFTRWQKIIYEIVLRANKECIKRIKPGVSYQNLQNFSEKILADGLIKSGLIKEKDRKEIKKYSLHGLGHHIGLDTHDAVPYGKTASDNNDALKAGNVITIEPGLYFTGKMKEIPKEFHGIGVRIEDDILVTSGGCRNLTGEMPKEIYDVESEMKS